MDTADVKRLADEAEKIEDPVVVPRKALNTAIGLDTSALDLLRQIADKDSPVDNGDPLHPASAKLVTDFAAAMASALLRAQRKYKHAANWIDPTWMDKCRADLQHQVNCGDPVLAGISCAFLWYHQESSNRSPEDEIAAMGEKPEASSWITSSGKLPHAP